MQWITHPKDQQSITKLGKPFKFRSKYIIAREQKKCSTNLVSFRIARVSIIIQQNFTAKQEKKKTPVV